MSKEILLVWQGTNEESSGTVTETDDLIVVYLDNKSKWEQMEKDIQAYKNRIKVLQNLNTKYREKLGISNEPIDALGLISPLEDVYKEKEVAEIPDPSHFMKLGEDEFNKNVHEKLRAEMSPREKIFWLNGYLLAVTQYRKR